jgi:hypothetical protein
VNVLSLISWIWGCSTDREVLDDPQRVRAEIHRLEDMVQAYRDFGYEDMAEECAQRKSLLERQLRNLLKQA